MARILGRFIAPTDRVLDVGAGGRGISTYIRNPCVSVDREPPVTAGRSFVRADATRLPFDDKSFAAVVQADVLEHLDPSIRSKVIDELFRVARKIVVIAAPCGRRAEEHDRRLWEGLNPRNHLRHFLEEHFDCGLPTCEEIVRLASEGGRARFAKPHLEIEKNANIRLRYWMMRGVVRAEDSEIETKLRLRTPFSPLLSRLRFGHCYRLIAACRETAAV
jgi:hypothetical protein